MYDDKYLSMTIIMSRNINDMSLRKYSTLRSSEQDVVLHCFMEILKEMLNRKKDSQQRFSLLCFGHHQECELKQVQ